MQAPGELVQVDTLTMNPGPRRPVIKQLNAFDPVAKWTVGQAWRCAGARNAAQFLNKLLKGKTDLRFSLYFPRPRDNRCKPGPNQCAETLL